MKKLLSLLCLGGLLLTVPVTLAPMALASPPPTDIGSLGPLAKELQGKPVVVDIFATWCPGCKNIASTLETLREEYKGKANFVVLDVTDRKTAEQAAAKAEQLGLSKYFAANKSSTSTVAIIDPGTGKILALFQNNPDKTSYTEVLNAAIAKK
ncbi:TlpA family protein disulfide reductase [Anthocerotibacter panamensis]|uniref:TlpA family protein disulfide reductase n=1 Tax=Anthocerotibacter panamensis TaxID=2857077 RepID=UPI001C405DF7|nr:thioredoxin family protein [Anthocerotibacter panamensis]